GGGPLPVGGGCAHSTTYPGAPAPPGSRGAAAPKPPPRATGPQQHEPSDDARLTVTDVRVGHHPGFDRVVYELGGTGTPGWRVQYTDRAVQDGSGKPVDVAGQSILQVQILGSAYPWDSGVTQYEGADPVTDPDTPGIAGVYRTLVFEGATQSFIGVNADRPAFSVDSLENPKRLVVDVATG
ncbi:AMIN-like domain-containing (lipo)protein, partial [Nocardia wallacei]|uniref:AMIN-like domain-containing (lipo)protein n=1 Tax=Nocardia wallacei TaxID=480035 RepID=UPI003CC808FB